jgi:short-subunit dehydrogenase
LINNAVGDFGMFTDTNWKKRRRNDSSEYYNITNSPSSFLRHGSSKKEEIMNVASTAAFQPGLTMAVYYATKAYVLHFSEAIDNEVRDKGITVTALCPGATESGFQDALT